MDRTMSAIVFIESSARYVIEENEEANSNSCDMFTLYAGVDCQ